MMKSFSTSYRKTCSRWYSQASAEEESRTPNKIIKVTHIDIRRSATITMTRLFFSIGHLKQCKFAQLHIKFPKVGSRVGQILNKPLNFPKTLKFAQMTNFRQISWSG